MRAFVDNTLARQMAGQWTTCGFLLFGFGRARRHLKFCGDVVLGLRFFQFGKLQLELVEKLRSTL